MTRENDASRQPPVEPAFLAESELSIDAALASPKVDPYIAMKAHYYLDDGSNPATTWFPALVRMNSEDFPPFPGELTRIGNIAGISFNLTELPGLVANPDLEYIEASR